MVIKTIKRSKRQKISTSFFGAKKMWDEWLIVIMERRKLTEAAERWMQIQR